MNGDLMRIFSYIKQRIGRLSLITQLAVVIAVILTATIGLLISYTYLRNIRTITGQRTQTETALLELENQNINAYAAQIDSYSLQLRNDARVLQLFGFRQPFGYADREYLQSMMRASFYTRNDLISYSLYLPGQNAEYYISDANRNIRTRTADSIEQLPAYGEFTQPPYFKAIEPSDEYGCLFVYYRSLIDIESMRPLAVVELKISDVYLRQIARNHMGDGEIFCLADEKDRILFSNSGLVGQAVVDEISSKLSPDSPPSFISDIDGEKYLAVFSQSETTGWKIISFKPKNIIDRQINDTRNVSLLVALIAILASVTLVIMLISVFTKPLSALAYKLRQVGKGNFKATTDISGCSEINNLAEDFNLMIRRINELIEKNYVAELNEKTARLVALEAQINPHFLYNTLQAISAEAILSGQPQIDNMVTALASLLRYSIKGGEIVTVEQEIRHVHDYLLLQKARFSDRLTYGVSVDDTVNGFSIPKISIQSLVENAIIHGMENNAKSMHLRIDCYSDEENMLIIQVSDNGSGMSPERLADLNRDLEDVPAHSSGNTGIGLKNLANRLYILFQKKARITVQSVPYSSTVFTLHIPIAEE